MDTFIRRRKGISHVCDPYSNAIRTGSVAAFQLNPPECQTPFTSMLIICIVIGWVNCTSLLCLNMMLRDIKHLMAGKCFVIVFFYFLWWYIFLYPPSRIFALLFFLAHSPLSLSLPFSVVSFPHSTKYSTQHSQSI